MAGDIVNKPLSTLIAAFISSSARPLRPESHASTTSSSIRRQRLGIEAPERLRISRPTWSGPLRSSPTSTSSRGLSRHRLTARSRARLDERHPALTLSWHAPATMRPKFGSELRAIRLLSVRDRYENTRTSGSSAWALLPRTRRGDTLFRACRSAAESKDCDSLDPLCRFQMASSFRETAVERINDFWDGMAQKTPGLLKRSGRS